MSTRASHADTHAVTDPVLLTDRDVADLLKCSPKTVSRLPIPRTKIGRLTRYRKDAVLTYLASLSK